MVETLTHPCSRGSAKSDIVRAVAAAQPTDLSGIRVLIMDDHGDSVEIMTQR